MKWRDPRTPETPPRRPQAEWIGENLRRLEEGRRCRFGRLCLGHHLLEMRPDQTAEISEMSQKVLASQQQAAKLLFELAHGTRQSRLGDVAGFGRTAEVQGLAEREEIADQVHLRTERSSMVSGKRDNRRTSL